MFCYSWIVMAGYHDIADVADHIQPHQQYCVASLYMSMILECSESVGLGVCIDWQMFELPCCCTYVHKDCCE